MVADEFLRYIDVDTYRSWNCDVRCGWYLLRFKNITCTNHKKQTVFDEKSILLQISLLIALIWILQC